MRNHDKDKAGGMNGLKRIFRTLASRNYRLFFTGQSISLIGTWMQRVAMSWLVYHLTSSEFLLGLVSFLGLIPVFALSPFAGVLADRFDRLHLLMAVSIMGMPYMVLMPVFAKDILQGGSHTLGFLMGAAGGGALCGAVYLAQRKTVAGLERVIPLMTGLFSLGLIGFALSRHQWLSLLLLVVTGFGMMVQMASSNTILQTIVDDDKRGRVMSFYVMCVMGTTPIGSLLAGAVAERLGTPETLLLGGIGSLAGALLFMRKLPAIREIIRPVYIEKGIISEVAFGLQAATQWPKPPAG